MDNILTICITLAFTNQNQNMKSQSFQMKNYYQSTLTTSNTLTIVSNHQMDRSFSLTLQ